MKRQLLAVLLACGAPLAQAQTWTQVLADEGGGSLTLAPVEGVDTDGQSETVVQALRTRSTGEPAMLLYSLNHKGAILPWLVDIAPVAAAGPLFTPQGTVARNGYRISHVGNGSANAPGNFVYHYYPGQTVYSNVFSFATTPGFRVLDRTSDGRGGLFFAYIEPAQVPIPRYWRQFANGQFTGRAVQGCLPTPLPLATELMAVDHDFASNEVVTVVTRCNGTPAQGGGLIALHQFDMTSSLGPVTRRNSPLYDSTTAPVVAVHALGGARFLVHQRDVPTGVHTLRSIDLFGDSQPLPLPAGFVPKTFTRTAAGGFIAAVNAATGSVGMLEVEATFGHARWVAFPTLHGLAGTPLNWAGDAFGNVVTTYRDSDGHAVIVSLSPNGKELGRRGIDAFVLASGGTLQLASGADNEEFVFAADVALEDGRRGIYVEQFAADAGAYEIPWPTGGDTRELPKHRAD